MSTSAVIVDGKGIAEQWLRDIAVRVQALGTSLHLASVVADDDDALTAFVRLKERAAHRCGIEFSSYAVEDPCQTRDVVRWLADETNVQGIFIELPLPEGWDEDAIVGEVPLSKDVDVITTEGERRWSDGSSPVAPPAVGALERVMRIHEVPRSGVAVVVGHGRLVGRPCAHWLQTEGLDVRVVDVDTPDPQTVAATADILVCGAGVPGLVTSAWVKDDAVVFDFGYARRGDAYVGDVDRASVLKRAALLTPVPGGMGPLVIAATLENLLELAMTV